VNQLPHLLPSTLLALFTVGMSLAFWSADRASPASRTLALSLVAIGIVAGFGLPLREMPDFPGPGRWLVLVDTVAILAFLEWLLVVQRQVAAGDLHPRHGGRTLRTAQFAGLVYTVAGLLAPEARRHDFIGALENGTAALGRPGFWVCAIPMLCVIVAALFGGTLFLRRRPDPPERVRVIGSVVAVPFLAVSMILPVPLAILSMSLGLLVILAATMHYLVQQGQRGEFMARFLSRRVAELVRKRGLQQAMRENSLELTVVCVDLRGFTAWSQAQSSAQVLAVLREYYQVACAVVARYGGTIKDLAGDGMLILLGAPLPVPFHAARSLEMADGIRTAVSAVAQRWSVGSHRLGVGIGIASGVVTVGAIDAGERYEYTAVGPAVNLASRLCELAADGEILTAERTLRLCRKEAAARAFEPRVAVRVKGFPQPVPHRNLRGAAPSVIQAIPRACPAQ